MIEFHNLPAHLYYLKEHIVVLVVDCIALIFYCNTVKTVLCYSNETLMSINIHQRWQVWWDSDVTH